MTQGTGGMPGDAARVPPIEIDARAYGEALAEIQGYAALFASGFSAAISDVVLSGKELDDALRSVAMRLASSALTNALAPVQQGIAQLLNSGLQLGTAQLPQLAAGQGSRYMSP